ncbi:DUF4127 family protein [Arthrobacter sp. H5]|uniref:DUF4127 family protein n=1 Tax=Arthrobacter sp. H5 TaxID=1267973 RepID=UPI0004817CC5|nr:DUF4127 family protein [Arthrobacter sp. H5]
MRIALVPLDERPVCTQLAAGIARIAGLECVLPPATALPQVRQPGNAQALMDWLDTQESESSHLVVSLEGLGFGGLIPSRIGQESIPEVLRRWSALERPGASVYAFMLVPRTPDSLDAMEEPDYWNPHGPALHHLSAALCTGVGVEHAREAVPEDVRRDWLARRMRQHTLALAAIDLAGRKVIDRLVIGIDDAAEQSLSATDQHALEAWVARLELGDRARVQPGADEIGAVLVARTCLKILSASAPRIGVLCADPEALNRVAPYESAPVYETIRRQIESAGGHADFGQVNAGRWDAVMVIHPPEAARTPHADWAVAPDHHLDHAFAAATAKLVIDAADQAVVVGLADVHRPNGADPALISALDTAVAWPLLSSFAAWNTAGNTVGTVAAQLTAAWAGRSAGTYNPDEASLAMARRVVEDYGWMSVERARVRAELGSDPTLHDSVSPHDTRNPVLQRAEERLSRVLERPGLEGIRIAPESLVLPWRRTFEIELTLEKHP